MSTRQLLGGWVKWVFILVVALSVAALALAAVLEENHDYWSSFLLEIGAALLLAIPLILIGGLLEARIADARRLAEEGIEEVRSEVAGVRQDVSDARMQIAELGRVTAQRIADVRAADSELVKELREDVSQRNAWAALRRAEELGALDSRGVRVRLPRSSSRVRFKADETAGDGTSIELGVETPAGDLLVEAQDWAPDEPAEDALTRVAESLQRAGRYPGDVSFDAGAIFERLTDTLERVLSLRSGGRKGAPIGPVVELAGGWAITSLGLEHLSDARKNVKAALLRSSSDEASVKGSVDEEIFEVAADYHRGEQRREAEERLRGLEG